MEARKILDEFSDRYNPSNSNFQLAERDLEKDVEVTLGKVKSRNAGKNIKFQFRG
jgi:hypothetical protein